MFDIIVYNIHFCQLEFHRDTNNKNEGAKKGKIAGFDYDKIAQANEEITVILSNMMQDSAAIK